jgi:hypothetical protein
MTRQTPIHDNALDNLRSFETRYKALEKEITHIRMERDRANLAFAELYSSHHALTIARDENGARFIEMRDRILALETITRTLHEWKHKYTEKDHEHFFVIGYQQALAEVRELFENVNEQEG